MQNPIIDVMRRLRRPASPPNLFYQRPHNYSIPVGIVRVCLSQNKQPLPCITLLIQADLGNPGIIVIGDSQVTLLSGLQLDSGKAALFTPSMNAQQQPGVLQSAITEGFQEVPIPGAYQYQSREFPIEPGARLTSLDPARIVIDVSDFWVIASAPDQRLRVFWVESTKV